MATAMSQSRSSSCGQMANMLQICACRRCGPLKQSNARSKALKGRPLENSSSCSRDIQRMMQPRCPVWGFKRWSPSSCNSGCQSCPAVSLSWTCAACCRVRQRLCRPLTLSLMIRSTAWQRYTTLRNQSHRHSCQRHTARRLDSGWMMSRLRNLRHHREAAPDRRGRHDSLLHCAKSLLPWRRRSRGSQLQLRTSRRRLRAK
mmetsp:Transcript_22133/g.40694  ORF Transcript_22133/g.40694 Transcript_22133/m.40694 type:complete len:202 (-) Transcript_22133:299-904(-)